MAANRIPEPPGLNCVCAVKGDDRYLLLYDNDNATAALRQVGLWASNPELNFTWFDAALLAQTIRKAVKA